MSERSVRWLPIGIVVVSIAALFYRLLLGEVIFWGTPLLQFYPWREMAFNQLRAGGLPLWNPMVGNGAPLLANYQTAVLYPPNWLYLIIPTEYAMGIVGVLHLVWAALGMMLYLRSLGIAPLGQGIGALSFALSGYLIGRFGFLSITSTVAWLPFLIWTVDSLLRSEAHRIRRVVILALVCAMLLLAGHAQSAFYSLLLAGAYALQLAISYRRPISLTLAGLGVFMGVLIAAAQLIPTLELMTLSQRSSGIDAAYALTYSFWPWRFLTLLSPNLFGSPASGDYWGYAAYWEDAVYVGLLTIILSFRAAFAWFRRRRDTLPPDLHSVPFYASAMLMAFFIALGQNNPIYLALYRRIPGLDLFQAPTRWTLIAVFSLSVLGGIGAHYWQTNARHQGWARRAIVVGIATAITALFAQIALGSTIEPSLISGMLRLGVLAALIAACGLWLRRIEVGAFQRPLWEAMILALLAVDLVSAHWGLNPTIAASFYHRPSELAVVIRESAPTSRTIYTVQGEYDAKFLSFYSLTDFREGDTEHWESVRSSLLPNLGMIDGVSSTANFDPLLVADWNSLIKPLDSLDRDAQIEALRWMNVGVLLAPYPLDGLEIIGQSGTSYAHRIPDPFPRAFVADCIQAGESLQCDPLPDGEALIVLDEPNVVRIEVDSLERAYLVLLDTSYPGWRVTVDGSAARIWIANTAFRAVQISDASQVVEFRYQPLSFNYGALISLAALVGCGLLWLLDEFRRRKSTALTGIDG